MLKRLFDFLLSALGLILLSPIFILIAVAIKLDSKGDVFYFQNRMGKNFREFRLFKFRTMSTGADTKGLLTVGMKDNRITRVGYFLRKNKLDELPQLVNVLIGDMSLVGPRPEVKLYTDLYSEAQKQVLSVKPGITDLASIRYSNENEILATFDNPEQAYIEKIMPEKLKLNLQYISNQSLLGDIKIILQTVFKITA